MIEQQPNDEHRVPASDFSMPTQKIKAEDINKADPDNKWIDDIYTQRKLKRDFQMYIFWITLILSAVMLITFSNVLLSHKHIMPFLEKTPFVIAPISLLAIMPGYWISLLIKGVFQQEKKEEDKSDGVLSSLPPYAVIKDITKNITSS